MSVLHLNPGDWFFGQGDAVAHTILGSCVSILLWHPTRRLCGISHCVLPSRTRSCTEQPAGFYVDETLQWLLAQMRQQQTHPEHYQAWLFGGGTLFANTGATGTAGRSEDGATARIAIGPLNVAAAQQGLTQCGISLMGQDCGQAVYRKLSVELASGQWRLDNHTSRLALSIAPSLATRPAKAVPPVTYLRK